MRFTFVTDKGEFTTVSKDELNRVNTLFQMTASMIHLMREDIDSYPDEIKGYIGVLNQLIFESSVVIHANEELEKEPEVTNDENMIVPKKKIDKQEEPIVKYTDNIVKVDFGKKD